ncbi:hypothetical protein LguiB_001287 [Lonicera macranthoides]
MFRRVFKMFPPCCITEGPSTTSWWTRTKTWSTELVVEKMIECYLPLANLSPHMNTFSTNAQREITCEESFDNPNIMNFPIVGEPTDPLADILNKLNLGDDERVTELIHFSHNHPLSLFDTQSNNGQMPNDKIVCQGCAQPIVSISFYGCPQYIWCAMLKRTVKHDWDKHDITLRYPPYSDHPDDFYCEICEEEIHPKFWLYHCGLCDQPFHTECLRPYYEVANIMVGGTGKATKSNPNNSTITNKAMPSKTSNPKAPISCSYILK